MNDQEYFRKNNWHQGDIIDNNSSINTLLNKSCGRKLSISPDLLLILSHSCDILHHKKEAEPYIDLIAGNYSVKDNTLLKGRNPRKLQIEVNNKIVHFIINDIIHINKNDFEVINPIKSTVPLEKNVIRLIVTWVSKRYIRAAFPDEFIRRFPKNHFDIIQKSSIMEKVSLIYIDINDTELGCDQDYYIIIEVGVQHNSCSETKSQVEDVFHNTFNIPGIIAEVKVHDEYDITYKTISTYKRFDWDFRSLPEDEGIAAPVFDIDVKI